MFSFSQTVESRQILTMDWIIEKKYQILVNSLREELHSVLPERYEETIIDIEFSQSKSYLFVSFFVLRKMNILSHQLT